MTRTEATGTVCADVRDDIGWITISNPAWRNALTAGMMADLAETLRLLDSDPAVRTIAPRGEGTAAFAAGADISEFEARRPPRRRGGRRTGRPRAFSARSPRSPPRSSR